MHVRARGDMHHDQRLEIDMRFDEVGWIEGTPARLDPRRGLALKLRRAEDRHGGRRACDPTRTRDFNEATRGDTLGQSGWSRRGAVLKQSQGGDGHA